MASDLLPAEPGTLALEIEVNEYGFRTIEHPVVGFAHVSGDMAHPLTVANCTNARAVSFPDGRVTDRRLRESFPTRAAWANRVEESLVAEPDTPETFDDVASRYIEPEPEPELRQRIDGLTISTRAKNALKNSLGATYVRDLAAHKADLVRNTKGVPPSAMAELREAMFREGVSFADEPAKVPSEGDNDDLL